MRTKKLEATPCKAAFLITLEVPTGVRIDDLRAYIKDAVGTWCRAGDPEDPLYDLDYDKIKVKRVRN